jgi:hypothetical protein
VTTATFLSLRRRPLARFRILPKFNGVSMSYVVLTGRDRDSFDVSIVQINNTSEDISEIIDDTSVTRLEEIIDGDGSRNSVGSGCCLGQRN